MNERGWNDRRLSQWLQTNLGKTRQTGSPIVDGTLMQQADANKSALANHRMHSRQVRLARPPRITSSVTLGLRAFRFLRFTKVHHPVIREQEDPSCLR